jgi:hypothetical protein
VTAKDQHPWTIRPGESSRSYQAFRTYMLMGTSRSIAKAAKTEGKSETQLEDWSARDKWVERSKAYDAYILTAEVDGFAEQVASVRSKHMEITDRLLDHLTANMNLWKPGMDPSIRWTNALAVALKSQQAALTLREDKKNEEGAIEKIMRIMERLDAE